MPKLVITQDGETREVALNSGDVLGRSAQNAIPLMVSEASRRHCQFSLESGVWFVEDLGSSNGTQVNGRRVTKFELQDGDVLTVGAVELRFLQMEVEGSAPDVEWGDDDISLEDERFLIVGGAGRHGDVVAIPEGTLTIGRSAKQMLVLKDRSVSSDHAELVRTGDVCSLRDRGSSNGTFINGRKITESELESGDVVRFGTISCTFGVGEPDAFSPPSETQDAPGQASAAFTRVMDTSSEEEEDPAFALSSSAPPQKEGIWNLVALVMLAALGGAAWYFMTWTPSASGGPAGRARNTAGNMLSSMAASFELPEEGGDETEAAALLWDIESGDAGDATLTEGEAAEGYYACRVVSGDEPGGSTLATLPTPVNVLAGNGYRLQAWCSGASGVSAVGVVWLSKEKDQDGNPIPIGRDVVTTRLGDGSEWQSFGGTVVAPARAAQARVGVGVVGVGESTFDLVSMVRADVPEGISLETSGDDAGGVTGAFKADLGAQGAVRFSRYGHRIIEAMGIEVAGSDGGGAVFQDELLVVDEGAPAGCVAGSLAGGVGDLKVSQTLDGPSLNVTFSGSALAKASVIRVPLVPRDDLPVQVTVLSGDQGVRHTEPFKSTPADSLIVGGGRHRVRMRFFGPDGPRPMKVSFTRPKNGLATVRLHLSGADSVTLGFQVDLQKERAEAERLVADAQDAERRKQFGKAIALCEQVMARFPFEETAEESARTLQEKLLQAGRGRVSELKARLDDAIFFRDLLHDDSLDAELTAEIARYQGTALESGLRSIHDEYTKTKTSWDLPRRQADAERAFLRAKDYMDGEKTRMALLFFKTIVSQYRDTDEADQSAVYIKRLERASGEGR